MPPAEAETAKPERADTSLRLLGIATVAMASFSSVADTVREREVRVMVIETA